MTVVNITSRLVNRSRSDVGSSDMFSNTYYTPEVLTEEVAAVNGDWIPASTLLAETENLRLNKLFHYTQEALQSLALSRAALEQGDVVAADDGLTKCAFLFEYIFTFCNVSDAVGLVSLKAFMCCRTGVVTDKPACLDILMRATTRLRAAPFMPFTDASELASEIERAFCDALNLPGYHELADLLLEMNSDRSE